jgi:hypothetical protein
MRLLGRFCVLVFVWMLCGSTITAAAVGRGMPATEHTPILQVEPAPTPVDGGGGVDDAVIAPAPARPPTESTTGSEAEGGAGFPWWVPATMAAALAILAAAYWIKSHPGPDRSHPAGTRP